MLDEYLTNECLEKVTKYQQIINNMNLRQQFDFSFILDKYCINQFWESEKY